MNAHPASHADQDEDFNLVALWLRTDAKRWLAGILAGAFAGAVALGVAMAISAMSGREFWYAAKLLGTAILGPFATEVGLGGGGVVGLTCLGLGIFFLLGIPRVLVVAVEALLADPEGCPAVGALPVVHGRHLSSPNRSVTRSRPTVDPVRR
jgi:hypothetical protein